MSVLLAEHELAILGREEGMCAVNQEVFLECKFHTQQWHEELIKKLGDSKAQVHHFRDKSQSFHTAHYSVLL